MQKPLFEIFLVLVPTVRNGAKQHGQAAEEGTTNLVWRDGCQGYAC